jgi:plastocyanin
LWKGGIVMGRPRVLVALLTVMALAPAAYAADPEIVITIKDRHFAPAEVPVPAGQKVKLIVKNEDKTTSEFESVDFHREKVVQAGGQITVLVGPLDPGRYEFFDDFHPASRGHLVVK